MRILLVIALLFATGCGPKLAPPDQRQENRFVKISDDGGVVVYKDTKTGCEFVTDVVGSSKGTLTLIPGTCNHP